MTALTLEDRIWGCLLGSAVGDALGAPTECMHYEDVRRFLGDYRTFEDLERIFAAFEPEKVVGAKAIVRQPFHPLGSVTDDTVLADLLLDCILEHDGRVAAHVFAEAWDRFEEPIAWPDGPRPRLNCVHWIERLPFYRNRLREIPKRELGHGEANATNAIMYIAPVGLLCAGDPLKAELMAADVTAVNQHGRPRDVAGGYAAALAACFLPGMTPERVIETALEHTRDFKHTREMRAMLDLAARCGTGEEFCERYYREIIGPVVPYQDLQHLGGNRSVSWNSSEVLGPALAAFRLTRGSRAAEMVLMCGRIGRDADTIARVAGGLAGAYLGPSAIPEAWASYVLARNPWLRLREKAEQLAALVRRRLAEEIQARQAVLGEAGAGAPTTV